MSAPLGNFSYWNSGFVTPDEASGPQAQAFLAALHQYDPNASFVNMGANIDGGGPGYDMLSFDPSKLPGPTGSGTLGPPALPGRTWEGGGGGFAPDFMTVVNPDQVKAPGDIVDSSVYGPIARNQDFKPQDDGAFFGTLDKVLPYAVMSALGWGAGAAGASLAGGAISPALGSALGHFAFSEGTNALNGGGFNPLSLGGIASAALGLPSWVPTAVSTLGGLAQGRGLSFNPYALATHYAPWLYHGIFGGGGGG